jgi:hypothetical protein
VGDEDRWAKVREIVRQECERIEARILDVLAKHSSPKSKIDFVNGKWVGITTTQREIWAAAYGAVDVESELRKAAAWISSNPHLAPKNQFGRFLNTWLARGQNQSSIRSIPTRSEPVLPKKLCEYCDKVATGSANRIWACGEHFDKALQHEPVPMFKNAVVAKPVAGRD